MPHGLALTPSKYFLVNVLLDHTTRDGVLKKEIQIQRFNTLIQDPAHHFSGSPLILGLT
jgi:hypothetical protein